ncbi:MAG: hypothetical protein ACR2PF_21040, partial [Rhizobiaceae bacterium]
CISQKGPQLFIRGTTFRMAPEFDTEEGQQAFEKALRETVRPQNIAGLISTAHVPNDDGSWFVVAIWQDKSSADAETPRIRAAWEHLSSKLQ